MALGITYSQNPSRLIEANARFMSDNIRQIGQQVQSAILEINTRKDLQRMAQDMQQLNVQSDEFPMAATQMAAQHPLAIQDPRGQMALNILGKAHGNWQQQKTLESRLNNQLAGIAARNDATLGQIAARTAGQMEVSSANNAARESLEEERQANRMELQGLRNQGRSTTGIGTRGGITEYQRRNFGIQGAKSQLGRVNSEIAPLEKQFNALLKEQGTLEGDRPNFELNKPRLQQIYDEKKKIGERLEALGKKRAELGAAIDRSYNDAALPMAESALPAEPDLGAIPDGEELGAVPNLASPDAITVIIRRDPKSGKRYEVDPATKRVIREVP